MTLVEWVIAGIVTAALAAGIAVIRKLNRPGQVLPGRMCAGCPNACSIREKPPACMEQPKGPQ